MVFHTNLTDEIDSIKFIQFTFVIHPLNISIH